MNALAVCERNYRVLTNYITVLQQWEIKLGLMEQLLLGVLLRHVENREVILHSQHSCTKGRLCLTNLLPFHDGVTIPVVRGRFTGVISLDFCKSFDLTPASLSLNWRQMDLMSGLQMHKELVRQPHPVVNVSESWWTSVTHSFSQGSALGLYLH